LLARVRQLSARLSSGQRKVVELFLTRCDQAVFFTSSQVARATSVSEATVVRAARALGFGGYPGLRSAFQSYFVERMSTVTRVKLTAKPRREASDIIDELLAAELANLEATRRRLDHKALSRAADLVAGARRVYVVGLRSGYGLAWLLYFSLRLVLGNARLVTPGVSDVPEQLEGVVAGDVVVGITFERYTRATVELFRACLAKGARGIALTDKATSPLAEGAEVVLEAQTRLSSFVDSFVAPTAMLNALVTLVAAKRRRRVLRALTRREADWQRHGTYL
jgi:DNA-binding MurR/RpiR family transcriptional regulator